MAKVHACWVLLSMTSFTALQTVPRDFSVGKDKRFVGALFAFICVCNATLLTDMHDQVEVGL